jgi:catechol 2,3-dioxygenase-like lactoylglutathione lyase family enzyme
MKSNIDTHGRIKCVTIATPLLARSLSDYRRIFGFVSIEDGTLDEDLAEAWAAPSSAGKRYALLQHKSGGDSFIRLVEGTQVLEYAALRSFGWASITFAINDLASLHENIDADGAFAILSAPSPKAENSGPMSAAICGQAHEIVTLFESGDATTPQILNATLAAPDRQAALDHYISAFQFEAGTTESQIRSITNSAFGMAAESKTSVSMTKVKGLPVIEIEQYPTGTDIRPMYESELPPGISIITIAVPNLDEIEEDFLSEPCVRQGPLYAGRRTATVMGPADELIELIEIG